MQVDKRLHRTVYECGYTEKVQIQTMRGSMYEEIKMKDPNDDDDVMWKNEK